MAEQSSYDCPECQGKLTQENNFWVCSNCGAKFCLITVEQICLSCGKTKTSQTMEKVAGDEWFDVFAETKKQKEYCQYCQPDTF